MIILVLKFAFKFDLCRYTEYETWFESAGRASKKEIMRYFDKGVKETQAASVSIAAVRFVTKLRNSVSEKEGKERRETELVQVRAWAARSSPLSPTPLNHPKPAAKLPKPPAKLPNPPVKLPKPPAKLPNPPAKLPKPPSKLPSTPLHQLYPRVQAREKVQQMHAQAATIRRNSVGGPGAR